MGNDLVLTSKDILVQVITIQLRIKAYIPVIFIWVFAVHRCIIRTWFVSMGTLNVVKIVRN